MESNNAKCAKAMASNDRRDQLEKSFSQWLGEWDDGWDVNSDEREKSVCAKEAEEGET